MQSPLPAGTGPHLLKSRRHWRRLAGCRSTQTQLPGSDSLQQHTTKSETPHVGPSRVCSFCGGATAHKTATHLLYMTLQVASLKLSFCTGPSQPLRSNTSKSSKSCGGPLVAILVLAAIPEGLANPRLSTQAPRATGKDPTPLNPSNLTQDIFFWALMRAGRGGCLQRKPDTAPVRVGISKITLCALQCAAGSWFWGLFLSTGWDVLQFCQQPFCACRYVGKTVQFS